MTDPKSEIVEYLTKKVALHKEHLRISQMLHKKDGIAHYETIISCLSDIIKWIETH